MNWPGHRFAISFFASVIVLWLLAMGILMRQSALPNDANGTMLVVFEPGTAKDQAFASIVNAGAKPVRETAFGFIWVVTGDEAGLAGRLKANGALGSYRDLPINPSIAGCVAIADAKVANAFGLQ
jgi:hypothetical protein